MFSGILKILFAAAFGKPFMWLKKISCFGNSFMAAIAALKKSF
jgi:hypothetical protein